MEAEFSARQKQNTASEYTQHRSNNVPLLSQEVREKPQLKTVNLSEFLPPRATNTTVWNIVVCTTLSLHILQHRSKLNKRDDLDDE